MAKVSFGACTAAQLATKVSGSQIVIGRIYFVTNGSILSIVKGLTSTTYSIVYQDAIASRPLWNTTGTKLSYTDASGSVKTLDMQTMAVADRTSTGGLDTTCPAGQYMGTLGGAADSPDFTALPTTGVRIDDYYKCVTAGTYNAIPLVVGDIIKATSTVPAWAKNNTLAAITGDIRKCDTLPQALARLATQAYVDNEFFHVTEHITVGAGMSLTLDHDPGSPLEAATKQYVDNKVVSMMAMKGSVATPAALLALTGLDVGHTYRITAAGTYAGQVCEIGDVIIVVSIAGGTTGALATWLVLQNNIDLAGVFTTVGVGLAETAGASGKTIKMPTITVVDNTSAASPAHGATFTAVDSVTRDAYGRVTAINIKTVTLPAETSVSATANASTAYKVLNNLTASGHALTPTYTDNLLLTMAGWSTDANVGNIVVGDTVKGAFNRVQNRAAALETRATTIEGLQDWIDG